MAGGLKCLRSKESAMKKLFSTQCGPCLEETCPDRAMCYSIPSLLPFIANPFGLQKQQLLVKKRLGLLCSVTVTTSRCREIGTE